jgi:predicted SAM-dependent methyltransferase
MKNLKKLVKRVPPFKKLISQKAQLQKEKDELQVIIQNIKDPRILLASKYISGSGIEIGPTYCPVKLPPEAKVSYVDHVGTEELRIRYPELKDQDLVEITIIDDGETLKTIKNNSLNFIIANHFLEHCQNPIGTILRMYELLKKDGIIYLALPDKRYTFDSKRPITSYAYLKKLNSSKKYQESVKESRYIEAVKLIIGLRKPKEIKEKTKELMDMGYSIHYQVWEQKDMIELFEGIPKDYHVNLRIQAMARNEHEVIFIVEKYSKP